MAGETSPDYSSGIDPPQLSQAELQAENRRLRQEIEQLRTKEAVAHSALNSLPANTAVLDSGGRIVAVNDAWTQFARDNGADLDRVGTGVNYLEVCQRAAARQAEGAAEALDGLQQILRGSLPSLDLIYPCHAPQEPRWFLMRAVPLAGDTDGAIVNHINITRFKLAEEEIARLNQTLRQSLSELQATERVLRQTHQKLAFHVENSPLAVIEWDSDWRVVYWSKGAERIFGWTAAEVQGKHPTEWRIVFEDDLPQVEKVMTRLTNDEPRNIFTNRNYRKDGSVIYCEWYNSVLRDDAGNLLSIHSLVQDVTDRIRAAQKYRQIVETATEGIWIIDPEARTTFVNQRICQMLGYTPAEMLGHHLFEFMDEQAQKEAAVYLKRRRQGIREQHDFRFRHRNGSDVWTIVSTNPIYAEDGSFQGALAMITDITQRRRAEQALRESEARLLEVQKLESIGRLAGGVAHDFNNMLTAILGYAELAQRELPPEHPTQAALQHIQDAAERSANLTAQLLAFARRQIISPQVVDLNRLVAEISSLLRRLIGEHIELLTIPAENLGRVHVDPGQCSQILINLAVNARDAMPYGGKLIIETANVTLDESYCTRHPEVSPGEYVALSVSDTGAGMSAEVQEHLFEPFFTTKEMGRGIGLGLATCYGIVRQHGGYIHVYSEPGRGTSFHIYFPRVDLEETPKQSAETPSEMPRGNETILLVEDEPMVRAFASTTLQAQGYRVIEAEDGEAAAQIVRMQVEPIHLLITDLVMPRLSGVALANQFQTLYPQAAILFISGYADKSVPHQGETPGDLPFLRKPFSAAALAHRVRETLDLRFASGYRPAQDTTGERQTANKDYGSGGEDG
jgi:two-component system cell cycle sensor histidine kinase/response regulator CckA